MPRGIKGKVAILGMGCSKFGERWDCDAEELMVEAYQRGDQGRRHRDVPASTPRGSPPPFDEVNVGKSGTPARRSRCACPTSRVTHVENYLRRAAPKRSAALSMRSPRAPPTSRLALGVEKLKDTGYGGLPGARDGTPTT